MQVSMCCLLLPSLCACLQPQAMIIIKTSDEQKMVISNANMSSNSEKNYELADKITIFFFFSCQFFS